jgi:hypothetical protein
VSGGCPARDPVDITVDACTRFAAHLMLLSHQHGERERLAVALAIAERAITAAGGSHESAGWG